MVEKNTKKSIRDLFSLRNIELLIIFLILGAILHFVGEERILPKKISLSLFRFLFSYISIRWSVILLFKKEYSKVLASLMLPCLWLFQNYVDMKPYYVNYKKLSVVLEQNKLKCSEGDSHACHEIASAAHSAEMLNMSYRYNSVACLFGDVEACGDISTSAYWDKIINDSNYESLVSKLCGEGDQDSCFNMARLKFKGKERENVLPILQQACMENRIEDCMLVGEYYKNISIIKAHKYLSIACSHEQFYCWRLEDVCSRLARNWEVYQNNNELQESLNLCVRSCSSGSHRACEDVRLYEKRRNRKDFKR